MKKFVVKIKQTEKAEHQPIPGVFFIDSTQKLNKAIIDDMQKSLNHMWLFNKTWEFKKFTLRLLNIESFLDFLADVYELNIINISQVTANTILKPMLKASGDFDDWDLKNIYNNNLTGELLNRFNLDLLVTTFGWDSDIVIKYLNYLGYRYQELEGYENIYHLSDNYTLEDQVFIDCYKNLNFYDIDVIDNNGNILRRFRDWYISDICNIDEVLEEVNCNVPYDEPENLVKKDSFKIVIG